MSEEENDNEINELVIFYFLKITKIKILIINIIFNREKERIWKKKNKKKKKKINNKIRIMHFRMKKI